MSLFNIWIDTPITSGDQNVISYDTLNRDAQRARGFKAGEAASALRVNTMLRQSSLVIKTLMDIIDNSGKLSVTSTSKDVYDIFNKYFNSFATKATTNSLSENISTIESNLDTLIEGLDTGTKVVNNAQNATYATYASEDISKGTIEERLTSLGFKTGEMVITGEPSFTGTNIITRQGNYAIANLDITFNEKQHRTGPTLFTININSYGNFNAIDHETLKGYAMLTFSFSTSPNVTMKKAFKFNFINSYTMAINSGDDAGPYDVEKIEILNFGFRVSPL